MEPAGRTGACSKDFEHVTVFLSGEANVTASALIKSFDSIFVNSNHVQQRRLLQDGRGRWHCESKCVSYCHSTRPFRKLRYLSAEHSLRLQVKVQVVALQRKPGGKNTNRQVWYRMTPPVPDHKRRRGSQSLCWTNCLTQIQSTAPKMTMIVLMCFSEPSVPKEQKPWK